MKLCFCELNNNIVDLYKYVIYTSRFTVVVRNSQNFSTFYGTSVTSVLHCKWMPCCVQSESM